MRHVEGGRGLEGGGCAGETKEGEVVPDDEACARSTALCVYSTFSACVWCVVCGVWCVVCGVWCVVCGWWVVGGVVVVDGEGRVG